MPKWEIAGDRPRLNFQQVRRIVVNAGSILKRHAKFEGQPSKCVEVVCFSDSVYLSPVIYCLLVSSRKNLQRRGCPNLQVVSIIYLFYPGASGRCGECTKALFAG